jgi:SET domain-containing protein
MEETKNEEAALDEGVEIRDSTLVGAGKGLFAKREFHAGDVICEYIGKMLSVKEVFRLEDHSYLMRLGSPNIYIDGKDVFSFARHINDNRNKLKHNVKFEKYPQERKALVVAIKNIKPGDELFVDYGKWYWYGKNHLKQ